jgi:apolipoprotein D and lipocalin family protein
MQIRFILRSILATITMSLAACAVPEPLATVNYVDIERFMGPWYVIASIPTVLEKGAHNAVETYTLDDDGTIATKFVFRKDGFDGERKEYNPRAWITDDRTNAVWGMQFIWPIKADYRIVYLAEDYSQTIIARNKRDFVWIMARTPEISEADYARLTAMIAGMGYDVEQLRGVPQQW